MASTRNVISPPVFAEDATTTIPTTPISGVSYRDPAAGPASSPDGWPYGQVVNSAEFNQIMYQLSTLVSIMDQKGVLGWSDQKDYTVPSIQFGSDGKLYAWQLASGPANGGAKDPISNPTYWRVFGLSNIARYTASGNFVVPAGVTTVYVSGCGAGGGGGSSLATNASSFVTGGSGGGAGQPIIRVPISVTPGATIPVTVGTGGAGGTAAVNNAAAGSNTQFGAGGSLVNLGGGSGGLLGGGGSTVPQDYGGPGGGTGFPQGGSAMDTVVYAGGIAFGGTGGIGASSPFGISGAPGKGSVSGSVIGQAGFGFGAGGSGAGGAYKSTIVAPGANGAAGLPGLLIIEW